ncbi:tetratricopeptide repeat protein [Levilactobacillus zymae]|uniref:tetratricopeptide repeat protein n=1 Tax=Levilactobacillus zymae TaxID=267363 RepID=UPI0028B49510|nr:tetratricopeptide repeat protein [Levilactobacillus zymae]MDT6980378.1 tetratricopeptide repeat protein [Levilactobacillus zymae]
MTEPTSAGRAADKQRSEKLVHQLVQQITQEPGKFEPYYELATVLVDLNSYAQAEELLMKALGLFAAQPAAVERLHYGLGNVYYAAQDYPKAIAQFDQLGDQLKGAGYLMIAQSHMANGDHKRALAFALTALTSQPKDVATLQVVAENLLALGNMAQAAQYYDQVLALDAKNGRATFDRGLVAMVQGEPYAQYFKRAQHLDPAYYAQGQKKLADIETFIQTQHKQKKE